MIDTPSKYCLVTPVLKIVTIILLLGLPRGAFCQHNGVLWYTHPASVWTEALPVGNGRLGAMIFGGVGKELIQLNEATLWTGGPVRTNVNPGAYENLLLARQALLTQEDYAKGYEYTQKMQGYYSESYLPLADLTLTQGLTDTAVSDYYRDLNITRATASVRFVSDHTAFSREVISSAPDQVIVIHLTSGSTGTLNLKVATTSLLRSHVKVLSGEEIILTGKAPSHIQPSYIQSTDPISYDDSAGCRGMRFALLIKIVGNGADVRADSSGITIKNGTDVCIFVSAATSFNGFDQCPDRQGKDEIALATRYMTAAVDKSWATLLHRHEVDYQRYFNRVAFTLAAPGVDTNSALPTDRRLVNYTNGAIDPGLETLYFQYGRYLLISSSRPGGPPANLQGIWNKELRPPWSSNYTTNINVEMNYWPAEATNLSDMQLPFIDFIEHAAVTGTVTAREFYHTRGWAVHHNSDIWALSNPVGDIGHGDPMWANWTMGSPWLSQHLWGHYAFTQDKEYLRDTAYPLMKGAAQFCMDWLVPYKGYLVTAPSVSPENHFFDDKGQQGSVSIATTMDMSIIRDLFDHMVEASTLLDNDPSFRDSIIAARKLLYPFQIGKKGNLQEWYKDWEDPEPHHRHVSQLFGLYPGSQISPITSPALAAAAKKTLELRGDEGTGWSLAWKINFWARLLDGNHSYLLLKDLLRATDQTGTSYKGGGGAYPNLFDAHPPFQIDGNFGGLAGMTEMLLQSQSGEIALLPALPDAWATGAISGLKARGNFEVAMTWKNKVLVKADIISDAGGVCRLRTSRRVIIKGVLATSTKTAYGYVIRFNTRKGKSYTVN